MRPVRNEDGERFQIGLHTNTRFCLHKVGLNIPFMPLSLIPVADQHELMTRTDAETCITKLELV